MAKKEEMLGAGESYPKANELQPGEDWQGSVAPNVDATSDEGKMLARMKSKFMVKVAEGSPISFPRPVTKGKGMPEETLIRNWKQQKRTKCGEARCYHPLNPKRLEDENSGEPLIVPTVDGGRAIAAECSWDPRHGGGLQFIPVPEQRDED